MHASAGVCGGEAAPGRGVMDTGIPATPARRCENAGRWGCRAGWTTCVFLHPGVTRSDERGTPTFVYHFSFPSSKIERSRGHGATMRRGGHTDGPEALADLDGGTRGAVSRGDGRSGCRNDVHRRRGQWLHDGERAAMAKSPRWQPLV
jgi:hypothetical protein